MSQFTPPISLDERLKGTLTRGFMHADALFGKMLDKKVSHQSYYFGLHSLSEISKEKIDLLVNEEHVFLVTTDLFGTAYGKSYLLLSENEVDSIIKQTKLENENQEMKISFIKELANILSASVITVFSNEFKISAFGDIPIMHPIGSYQIEEMIKMDFSDFQQVHIIGVHLTTEPPPNLKLVFIWVINKEDLEKNSFETKTSS